MRIKSILFIYFVAMLVQSLVERQARLTMKRARIRSIPICHESRECEYPTAGRLLSCFGGVQIRSLSSGGSEIEIFQPELTPLQKQPMNPMDVEPAGYTFPASK